MFMIQFSDYSNESCGVATMVNISEAMHITKECCYRAEIMDMSTGEILWIREGEDIIYSIFA